MKTHVRWMIRADIPAVLDIESRSFQHPWSEEEFIRVLRKPNCIGMVIEDESETVRGYMIYELHKNRFHLLSLAVHPDHWRKGFARRMIKTLAGRLTCNRRTRILCEIRECNLAAQQAFRAMGFKAVSILKEFFDDSDEDAYVFQYKMPVAAETVT